MTPLVYQHAFRHEVWMTNNDMQNTYQEVHCKVVVSASVIKCGSNNVKRTLFFPLIVTIACELKLP